MWDNRKIIIVGAGLSGLTVAYLLSKKGVKAQILEASARAGGRIHTIKGQRQTPLELGATWFSNLHVHLLSLLEELGLQKYPQFSKGITLFQTKSFEPPQEFHIPEAQDPSYRVVGGTSEIIRALCEQLDPSSIHLHKSVTHIDSSVDRLLVSTTDGNKMMADAIVMAMPLPVIHQKISFSPSLPKELFDLLPTVQTWMAGSIKFVLEYANPFWRNRRYSGMLFSHSGIVTEMYDHTNYEENKFGFTGFLNGGAALYSPKVRREIVLKQLSDLLGADILNPILYNDKVWDDTYISAGNQRIQRPHQNNGHPLLQRPYLNNKLYFCGTEVSSDYPGYMEGAVLSAKNVCNKILSS